MTARDDGRFDDGADLIAWGVLVIWALVLACGLASWAGALLLLHWLTGSWDVTLGVFAVALGAAMLRAARP